MANGRYWRFSDDNAHNPDGDVSKRDASNRLFMADDHGRKSRIMMEAQEQK
jgi:hypothetical protein